MSSEQKAKTRRHQRLKNPTSSVGPYRLRPSKNPVGTASRVRVAIQKARAILREFKQGDQAVVTQAVMLPGILSGDIMAAMVHTRQRLQNENLRLRRRITMSRLKTEEAKARLLSIEADRRSRPEPTASEILSQVRAIYGLTHTSPPLLPAPADAVAEILSEPTDPQP
jgi:hypothetical protein